MDRIHNYLKTAYQNLEITILSAASSTNTLLCRQAVAGAKEGMVIIAKEQTAGRGRRGRSFFSPAGTGLYISILLRPEKLTAAEAANFTTMAAVAMCEAVEEITDKKAEIKWVNDIFVNNRKVCGILTEAFLDSKTGMLDYAVLGAGVNVFEPKGGFPEEIEQSAGALLQVPQEGMKERLAAAFLNHFLDYYYHKNRNIYIEEYRKRSLAIGKEVKVLSGKEVRKAFAYDVDKECRLLVRYENGETEALSSGEISIRL